MPLRKTEEEKQAAAAQQAEQERAEAERQQALQAQKAAAQHAASPVGRAETAHARGAAFFQVELDSSHIGDGEQSSFGSSGSTISHIGDPADVIGQIEAVGWRLEHAGWVFVETGATTSNRMLGTGQGTVTSGRIIGIFLFRAANPE